jgi:hypothetical protein
MTLFPTPVLPVKKTGLPTVTSISRRVVYLTVSTVGTIKEKNGIFGSYEKAGTIRDQCKNLCSFSLK